MFNEICSVFILYSYRFLTQSAHFEAMANEFIGYGVLMSRLNPRNINISWINFTWHRRWWTKASGNVHISFVATIKFRQ